MNRRTFLTAAGAVAGVEIDLSGHADDQPEAADHEGDGVPGAGAGLADVVRSLPAAGEPADGGEYAFVATRLDDPAVTATGGAIADATACGTAFAGRVAVDVAFGLPDTGAFTGRLLDEGHEPLGTRDGWTLLGRRRRTRRRIVAAAGATAIVGTGPVGIDVEGPVGRAIEVVDRDGPAGPPTDGRTTREAMLDRLGAGTHLYVDVTPDPRRAGESAVATGERYDVRGEATAVRGVTLFESPASARTADTDGRGTVRTVAERAGADVSVRRRGRALVRDATVPTARLRDRP